jgi:protein tyrosine/serine phosphatase
MKKVLLVACFALVSILSFDASAALPEKFFEVSPGIYRSAQPQMADMRDLRDFGIKTILTLNDDETTLVAENNAAKALGIKLIAHPMSGFWSPRDRQVDASLAALQDQDNYPILVHCKHGEDRTGLIIGLHRVQAEGWLAGDAYEEMLDRGFHKILVFLNRYFKARTGLDD